MTYYEEDPYDGLYEHLYDEDDYDDDFDWDEEANAIIGNIYNGNDEADYWNDWWTTID